MRVNVSNVGSVLCTGAFCGGFKGGLWSVSDLRRIKLINVRTVFPSDYSPFSVSFSPFGHSGPNPGLEQYKVDNPGQEYPGIPRNNRE